MKHISSRDNPRFKSLIRVASGKTPGRVMLEGVHLCQEWLQRVGQPEHAFFDIERLEGAGELTELSRAVDRDRCLSLDADLARKVSHVQEGQGVFFVVQPPEPALPERLTNTCLWLDRIQDPGNLGTLLRTAAAAGIGEAYLSTGTAGAWSAKVLRSAQGAHFAMRIHEHVDLLALRSRLSIPLLATALEGAESLYEHALPSHCAWLMGNEGQGVAPNLLKSADRRVFIPQAAGVESLNVAAAAAICLFEQRRQHPPD